MNNKTISILDYQIELEEKVKNKKDTSSYISVFLEDEEEGYLIRLEDVDKISRLEHISKLGVCKNWFQGIVAVNNNVYSLINLNVLFKKNKNTNHNELVLLKNSDFAFSVQKIGGLINSEDLIDFPNSEKTNFIVKEYLHKTTTNILRELDVEKLLNHEDLKNAFNAFT